MSETILVRHPGLDAVVEIPKAGLAQYRQGGWEPLTDDEVEARAQAALDERAAADKAMAEAAEAAEAAAGPAEDGVSPERAALDEEMRAAVAADADARAQALAQEREAAAAQLAPPDEAAADDAPADPDPAEPEPRKSRRSTTSKEQ